MNITKCRNKCNVTFPDKGVGWGACRHQCAASVKNEQGQMIHPTGYHDMYLNSWNSCNEKCDMTFPNHEFGWSECKHECDKIPVTSRRYNTQSKAINAAHIARERTWQRQRRAAAIRRHNLLPSALAASRIGQNRNPQGGY